MLGLAERFARLFQGRQDAYGTDYGGSVKQTFQLWDSVMRHHLDGTAPIGVYPMKPFVEPHGWMVKWGCVDFDVRAPRKRRFDFETEAEAHEAALELVRILRIAFDITGFIEVTKSHARHVWVFAEDWVPATDMRRALLVACELAEVPTTEVNPKAEWLPTPETLGNYVRLPYPGALSAAPFDNRFFVMPDGRRLHLTEVLDLAEFTLASADTLHGVATLYRPKPTNVVVLRNEPGEVDVDECLLHRMGPLARKILVEGPLEGGDRSNALYKLAAKCREDGLTPDETLAVVTEADLAWGKFHRRAGGERYLLQMVERVYG